MEMDGIGNKPKKNTKPRSVNNLLESGQALGQIAAAARGLEITIEQKANRERELIEENQYLRDSGRQLATELTDLLQKVSNLEEHTKNQANQLEEATIERARILEDFQHREHAWKTEEEKRFALLVAENSIRENEIRAEILKVTRIAETEARIERERLKGELIETHQAFDSYRTNATAEASHLHEEIRNRTAAFNSAQSELAKSRAQFLEFQAAAERRIAALDHAITESDDGLRIAQTKIAELTLVLEQERSESRRAIEELKKLHEESESRAQTFQSEAKAALRQARTELETRLEQARYEAQTDLDHARQESRDTIHNLERAVQDASAEVEAERKLKRAAEERRHTAEQALDGITRDTAARIRRLEDECANLAEELRQTLEISERRLAEMRVEHHREKTKIISDSAKALAESKAREDDARERVNALTVTSESFRRESEAAKREISRLRSPQARAAEHSSDALEKLKRERELLLRARAEERSEFQSEISKLKAELELTAKKQREIQTRRAAAEVEELRFEREADTESEIIENPLAEILERKELEIKKARSRLAKEKPVDH
jgi:hypothetical protein